MNTTNPIMLPYNDDITIHIAGPAEEIISFFGLDINTRGEEPASHLKFETMTEDGEWQASDPNPTFFDELDRLAKALPNDAQTRGADSTDLEFWLPEGFESLWELAVSQLHEDSETPRDVAVRSANAELLSDTQAFRLLNALGVKFTSKNGACTRVSLIDKVLSPGRTHCLAFGMQQKSPFVEVKALSMVQVFVGVLDPTEISCSSPLSNWEDSGGGFRRCNLPERDDFRYGIVLFNKRSDRPLEYELQGGCRRSEKT